jgi:delta24-sterol reductase
MEKHNSKVAELREHVARFNETKTPFRIYHGSTLSTRESSRRRDRIIDVSSLNRVLEFNEDEKVVLVEPNVPMDKLVEATLAHGFLPKVVMGTH